MNCPGFCFLVFEVDFLGVDFVRRGVWSVTLWGLGIGLARLLRIKSKPNLAR